MEKDILFFIKETMHQEIDAIKNVCDAIDESSEKAVNLIHECKGKVIFTGVGKSGHIGEKLAATFASTEEHHHFLYILQKLFMEI